MPFAFPSESAFAFAGILIAIDLRAINLDIFSRVNLNRLETFPNSPTGFTQFSYTPDQWTNGAALRSKVLTDALTKLSAAIGRRLIPVNKRPSLRLEPFASDILMAARDGS